MATANEKVSLGIKLVRTKMQFPIKRVIATTIFKNRAGVKKASGKITITGAGRCFITVKQAAKGKFRQCSTALLCGVDGGSVP